MITLVYRALSQVSDVQDPVASRHRTGSFLNPATGAAPEGRHASLRSGPSRTASRKVFARSHLKNLFIPDNNGIERLE